MSKIIKPPLKKRQVWYVEETIPYINILTSNYITHNACIIVSVKKGMVSYKYLLGGTKIFNESICDFEKKSKYLYSIKLSEIAQYWGYEILSFCFKLFLQLLIAFIFIIFLLSNNLDYLRWLIHH